MDGLMNDTHWNTISNVYTLGQIRHIIYVQCPHTGIFVSYMGIYDNGTGITSGNHRIPTSLEESNISPALLDESIIAPVSVPILCTLIVGLQ